MFSSVAHSTNVKRASLPSGHPDSSSLLIIVCVVPAAGRGLGAALHFRVKIVRTYLNIITLPSSGRVHAQGISCA